MATLKITDNLLKTFSRQYISVLGRAWSGNSQKVNYSAQILRKTLDAKFPMAKTIVVKDISGGCGSMYEIFIETTEFQGLSTVKQHRLVVETLRSEIKEMHGLRIHTAIAESREQS